MLYDLLFTQPSMYEHCDDPALGTDYISVLYDVPVIRDDSHRFLEQPLFASFISCAAPMCDPMDPNKSYIKVLERRVERVVLCAAQNGLPALVLGAFGCGANSIAPEDSARAFFQVLQTQGQRYRFRKIVFAIPGPAALGFAAFKRCFEVA
jgi:uncharacterized protein (TIGR02452 family)